MPVSPLMADYSGGFNNGVAVRGMPIFNTYTGNVFWVNSSGGSNSAAGTVRDPFSTLDFAIGKCVADNGDVIMLAPNHAETITSVGGITADVAGITIIGLGSNNQRPRFLMDGADTVTFAVSAADVTIRNCVFASGHADIATCFALSTAVGFWCDDCEFVENTTNEDWLSIITSTGATGTANGLKVTNCKWLQASTSGLEFISLTDDVTGMVVTGNLVVHEGTNSQLILSATGQGWLQAFIAWNFLSTKGATGTDLFTTNDFATNTGIAAHNRFGHADATGAHVPGPMAGIRQFDNLSTSVATLSGFPAPAADVNL